MKIRKAKFQIYKSVGATIILVVFVIAGIFSYSVKTYSNKNTEEESQGSTDVVKASDENLVQEAMNKIDIQRQVDKQLQAELMEGQYNIKQPFVVLDPYGESPLTALILFKTKEPAKVSIKIKGEDIYSESKYDFEVYATEHIIPVFGLYPEKANLVNIITKTEEGCIEEANIEIKTEELPEDLSNLIILSNTFRDSYQEGINYTYEGRKMAFDKNGDIRWYLNDKNTLLATEYKYGEEHFIIAKGNYHVGETVFYEIDKLGKIYNAYYSQYGVHHDIESKNNGNLLITGSQGETVEDFMYEMDVETGSVINTMDFKKVLQRTRKATTTREEEQYGRTDWLHQNSVVWTDDEKSVIISSNFQSTVAKISWPEGEIQWILSSPEEWAPRLSAYILNPVGSKFEYSYNQHAAEILPDYDKNPETIDILLFDNGSSRFIRNKEIQQKIKSNNLAEPELYSRMVHYRINEKTMEVQQLWQYGKERGEELYGRARGDADLLDNGNRIGFFFKEHNDIATGIFTEVNSTGNLIWEAEVFTNSQTGNYWNYRVERLPFYSPNQRYHDIYMSGSNRIPEEIISINISDKNR